MVWHLLKDSEKIKRIKAIIEKHEISCGEDIWQSYSIIENALSIIEEICEIVGYYEEKEEVSKKKSYRLTKKGLKKAKEDLKKMEVNST